METINKRIYPRFNHEMPILYTENHSGCYHDGVMVNQSEEGIYFRSRIPVSMGSELLIHHTEAPTSSGANIYLADVRWCMSETPKKSLFGIGAFIREKGCAEINGSVHEFTRICDRCGHSVVASSICEAFEAIYLCKNCQESLKNLPHCKQIIQHILDGNII